MRTEASSISDNQNNKTTKDNTKFTPRPCQYER